MEIIPAIDIIEGKCVRLTQGDFKKSRTYHTNPVEVAKGFEDAGIRRLHLVDLDGARNRRVTNAHILEAITKATRLVVDFGGGVQSGEDIEKVFECGAHQVTGGSIAVRSPEVFEGWIEKYGSERIILGADVKDRQISIGGWQEQSDLELFQFLKHYLAKRIKYAICTDVSKDGLLQGPALTLYQEIIHTFPSLKLIASGGVSSVEDLDALKRAGVSGVIIGKAIYEGNISLEDLKSYL